MLSSYIEGAKIFKALNDPKRTMIIDMLSCGEVCAYKILEKVDSIGFNHKSEFIA